MLDDQVMADVLFAVATGYPERSVAIVDEALGTDSPGRGPILAALSEPTRSLQARRLGDALRAAAGPRHLINECYRVAFYSGEASAQLAANPMFAYFLANRSGPQLDKWPHYFPIYHRHLERFRGRPVRVLEIGVYRGGGMAMLRDYFGPEAVVVGVDIDDAAMRAARGFVVEVGDQEDAAFLAGVTEQHGPWDIVIDDGGHTMRQQIAAVEALFPSLVEGGVYFVEDCHTSYWSDYGDPEDADRTFLNWVRARIDDLNAHHHSLELDLPTPWATSLDGLHIYDSVVVLDKATRFAPFGEMSGASEYVYFGRDPIIAVNEMRAARDHSFAVREGAMAELETLRADHAMLTAEVATMNAKLLAIKDDVVRTEGALTLTRDALDESQAIVEVMRNSTSWRVTEPLRRIRASVSRG